MKQLTCKIVDRVHTGIDWNLTYAVFDGEDVVATGVSSSEHWVRNDAGGYHTKNRFDESYPQGWNVSFDF